MSRLRDAVSFPHFVAKLTVTWSMSVRLLLSIR